MKKINVFGIVRKHFATLKNSNTRKASFDDWFTFLVFPIGVAAFISYFKPVISESVLDLLIASLSIFVGLLINVVVLIFSIIQKEQDSRIKSDVLGETITNICYTILISLITIVFAFIMFSENLHTKEIFTCLIYFLTIHFLVTLLMIIKRMYLLFIGEIDNYNNN